MPGLVKRLTVSKKAKADINEIWHYIALDSRDAATRVVREIQSRFPLLQMQPKMGRDRSEFGQGRRSHAVGNYVIFYEERPRSVLILRVVHGARDLGRIFS